MSKNLQQILFTSACALLTIFTEGIDPIIKLYLELTAISICKYCTLNELRYAMQCIFSNHVFFQDGSNALIPAAESGQISTFDWLVEKYKLNPDEAAKVHIQWLQISPHVHAGTDMLIYLQG